MPRHAVADARRLGDEVAGPQRDVGADQRFDDVEHASSRSQSKSLVSSKCGTSKCSGD